MVSISGYQLRLTNIWAIGFSAHITLYMKIVFRWLVHLNVKGKRVSPGLWDSQRFLEVN
jgi:hypothetical protein